MRRNLLLILLVFSLIGTIPASAQSSLVLDRLEIGLWPEYDRPDVLVIYRIFLSSEVSLPVQMSFRIPREVGAPYNLAMKDMDGMLYNLAYTTELQDEWLKVTFTSPSSEIQLEYYDPSLNKNGAVRDFEFVWTGDYTVNNMVIDVQQPSTATDMQIFPTFGAGLLGEDGLTYYSQQVGSVKSGTTVTVRFTYNKPDDELSFGSQSVQPVQAASTAEAGKIDASSILPWIIGGVGMLLVVGGLVWFMAARNREAAVARAGNRRHRPAHHSAVSPAARDSSASIYCSQCGRKAAPGDVFCRSCGKHLRTD